MMKNETIYQIEKISSIRRTEKRTPNNGAKFTKIEVLDGPICFTDRL
jgi:hypothetical protein